MKTNESVILAHGWEKNASIINSGHSQCYSKSINNLYTIIYLNKNGSYGLSIYNHAYLLTNLDTYMAVAEEMKLLNVETAK